MNSSHDYMENIPLDQRPFGYFYVVQRRQTGRYESVDCEVLVRIKNLETRFAFKILDIQERISYSNFLFRDGSQRDLLLTSKFKCTQNDSFTQWDGDVSIIDQKFREIGPHIMLFLHAFINTLIMKDSVNGRNGKAWYLFQKKDIRYAELHCRCGSEGLIETVNSLLLRE